MAAQNKSEKIKSTLPGLWKYPSRRDDPLHSGGLWLQGRREDDGAEGLWRVHDELYDLSCWARSHPGGEDWITLTQGTDVTEAFEAHHLAGTAEHMLKYFHVRSAKTRRNSPYTFKDDGFYRTLKRRAVEALNKKTGSGGTTFSKVLADTLVSSMLVMSVLAAVQGSYRLGVVAALFLTFNVICAHNFTHMKDNFRMYYLDFSMMSSREWRISHVLSHHLYPNTLHDLELSVFEPLFLYLSIEEKSWMVRYGSLFYTPLVYLVSFHLSYVRRIIDRFFGSGLKLRKADLIPFIIPASMVVFGGVGVKEALVMWTYITMVSSLSFFFIGFTAAHHHPTIFHDGDAPRADMDWGVQQLDAVRDRPAISSSDLLALTFFGHHGLHHLFPTVDHRFLHKLYPAFQKTCKEFGIVYEGMGIGELIYGTYAQAAKIKPNPIPPGSCKRE